MEILSRIPMPHFMVEGMRFKNFKYAAVVAQRKADQYGKKVAVMEKLDIHTAAYVVTWIIPKEAK